MQRPVNPLSGFLTKSAPLELSRSLGLSGKPCGLIALTHFGLRLSLGEREPMKRLELWSLVAVLAVGELMGCSRASTKPPNASDGIRAGRGIAEGRQEVASGTTQLKPSACIKRDKGSGRLNKPLAKGEGRYSFERPREKTSGQERKPTTLGALSFMNARQELEKLR